MLQNVSQYIDFFRQLAVKHKDILHNPASESGDGLPGAQHFTRISTEEVLAALNSNIGFPCLTLELYEVDTSGDAVNPVMQPKGAFMVVTNPADLGFTAQMDAFIFTERITYDILRRINQLQAYDNCNPPGIDFTTLSITPVGPVFSGQYGYRVVFDFSMESQLTTPPDPGTFNP